MKLVKLVYISHGWYLGLTDKPLILEAPEAWKYGPVIPSVYHHFKSYEKTPIKLESFISFNPDLLSEKVATFLDKIWDVYGGFNGIDLSMMTHEVGNPWYITWQALQNNRSGFGIFSKEISESLIREHYKERISRNKAKAQL